ncbi:MAG: hypothetical protein U1F65_01200 [Verrucomicrobiota bacterium]
MNCFDAAITLRRQLPLAANPWFRYGLIAGWLNRADALTRLGSADNLNEALGCFDEALAQLRELPMNESHLFVKRLAIAWLNRGLTFMKRGDGGSLRQSVDCFAEAVAAAKNYLGLCPEEARPLLAAAWLNRGIVLLRLGPAQAEPARTAARQALSVISAVERDDEATAEVGFKARHVLCQALAILITGSDSVPARLELLAEATDAVDEGMALGRHWETRGQRRFRPEVAGLFHFGCRAFQAHQPHFLVEFLLENLDPAESEGAFGDSVLMQATALNAIWHSLQDLQRDGFKAMNTPDFERLLARLGDLRIAGERLSVLRARTGSKLR